MRLIDADALKKKARYAFKSNTGGHIPPIVSTDDIDNAPTIEAEPVRHGRWVHKGAWHIECSECCHILAHIGEAKNYCPNCGARMDGESE